MTHPQGQQRKLHLSVQEYWRGIAGGLIFSLPLLYTMEVWWAGFTTHPLRLLIYVLATFTLLLGYNHYGGLRRDASNVEVAIDSVEEMGIGLLLATVVLWLLGRITADMSLSEIAGKIIVEAMTVAIGVAVGTAQLGGGEGEDSGDTGMEGDTEAVPFLATQAPDFGGQVAIATCGAVLFAANVAPTEEILMIAVEIDATRLLGLAVFSLILGTMILFYSNFIGAQKFITQMRVTTVLFGAVITYAIALVTSAAILWFFGRFDDMSLFTCLAQTIVLGLAATLGASAGRLLLQ